MTTLASLYPKILIYFYISLNKIDKGSIMEEQHLFKTLNENLDSLLNLKKKLAMLNDVKLNTLYSTLTPKNFIKKIAKNREKIKSTLCVKVKQKNIRKVSFGICVDIGVDIIYDYLHDKEILSINLNFNLKHAPKKCWQ